MRLGQIKCGLDSKMSKVPAHGLALRENGKAKVAEVPSRIRSKLPFWPGDLGELFGYIVASNSSKGQSKGYRQVPPTSTPLAAILKTGFSNLETPCSALLPQGLQLCIPLEDQTKANGTSLTAPGPRGTSVTPCGPCGMLSSSSFPQMPSTIHLLPDHCAGHCLGVLLPTVKQSLA